MVWNVTSLLLSIPFLYRVVLGAVPLNLDLEGRSHDFPRSWMLPVLKSHVQATELGYFKDVMMPLAGRLGAKGGRV